MIITLPASDQVSTMKELLTTTYVLRHLVRSGLDYSAQLQELGFKADSSTRNAKPIVRLRRTAAGAHLTLGAYSKPVAQSVRAAA